MPADVSRCTGAAAILRRTDFWASVDSLRVIRSSRAQQLTTPLTRLINHERMAAARVNDAGPQGESYRVVKSSQVQPSGLRMANELAARLAQLISGKSREALCLQRGLCRC